MADSFNASIRAIGDFVLGEVVDKGKDYLASKQTIQNQILSSSLKKTILVSSVQNSSWGRLLLW